MKETAMETSVPLTNTRTERMDGSFPSLIRIKRGVILLNMYFLSSLFKSICFLGVVEHENDHRSRGSVGNGLIDSFMF